MTINICLDLSLACWCSSISHQRREERRETAVWSSEEDEGEKEENAKVLRAINILTAISSLSLCLLSYIDSHKNNRYFDADELPTDLLG